MLSRRKFISLTAGIALAPLIAFAPVEKTRQPITPDKIGEDFQLYKFFDIIKFYPGQVTEFPLQYQHQCKSFFIPNHGVAPERFTTDLDYLIVPTYDISGHGDHPDDIVKIVNNKLNYDATRILYPAAQDNPAVRLGVFSP